MHGILGWPLMCEVGGCGQGPSDAEVRPRSCTLVTLPARHIALAYVRRRHVLRHFPLTVAAIKNTALTRKEGICTVRCVCPTRGRG